MGLIYLIVHLVEVFTWGSCFGMGEAKTAALDFGEPGDYEVYNYNLNVTAFWRVWTFSAGGNYLKVRYTKEGENWKFELDDKAYGLLLLKNTVDNVYIVIKYRSDTKKICLHFASNPIYRDFVEKILESMKSRLVGWKDVDFEIKLRL